MLLKKKTCCFTGHRAIANIKLPLLKQRLDATIGVLIHQGVIYFGCGGAIGFDMLAGCVVLDFKKKYEFIRLIMVLPCHNQDAKWSTSDKAAYRALLTAADKTVYLSEKYYDGCMKKRNLHLVENSGYCVAYHEYQSSGTSQTLRMAKERGLTIFNLA